MGKYLELFLGEVGDLTEKTKIENKPYVAYSIKEGKVTYTVVPVKDPVAEGPADNEIWYTTSDGKIVDIQSKEIHPSDPYDPSMVLSNVNIVSNIYENGKGIITFDGTVSIINGDMFSQCSLFNDDYEVNRATSITIPKYVVRLGQFAFSQCYFDSITIPTSVCYIDDYAFSSSTIKTIIYEGTTDMWDHIEKGRWNLECPEITIHCTDGDITIPAN